MSVILLENSPQLTPRIKPTNKTENVISADLLIHVFPYTYMIVEVYYGTEAIM
jgi:hypothetical protein